MPTSPIAVQSSRSPSPVNLPQGVAPQVLAPASPLHTMFHLRLRRKWTLAEIIEHCTTWEKYEYYRPVGYRRLGNGWAVLDEKIRKRCWKHPKELKKDSFSHVRSYTQNQLSNTPLAWLYQTGAQ